jgi:methyltransferase (TIGR00027 family)
MRIILLLLALLTSMSHAFVSPVAETCRKTLAYRCVSRFFPVDNLALRLAGKDKLQDIEKGLVHLQQNSGAIAAQNVRENFAVRYFWFSQQIQQLIQEYEYKQVIFIGAGFDTRAYSLQCLESTNVFEIDLPEVIEEKNLAILQDEHLNTPLCNRLVRCGIDLVEDDLFNTLIAKGFDHEEPTLWVAEGSLYYLDNLTARRLLKRPLMTASSTILFDMTLPNVPNHSDMQDIHELLKFGMNDPVSELQEIGYTNITVHQVGDENANFGALDTNVINPYLGSWAFKYSIQIDNVDGERLQRFFLIKASTQ